MDLLVMLLGISKTRQQFSLVSCVLSIESLDLLQLLDSSSGYAGELFSAGGSNTFATYTHRKYHVFVTMNCIISSLGVRNRVLCSIAFRCT